MPGLVPMGGPVKAPSSAPATNVASSGGASASATAAAKPAASAPKAPSASTAKPVPGVPASLKHANICIVSLSCANSHCCVPYPSASPPPSSSQTTAPTMMTCLVWYPWPVPRDRWQPWHPSQPQPPRQHLPLDPRSSLLLPLVLVPLRLRGPHLPLQQAQQRAHRRQRSPTVRIRC